MLESEHMYGESVHNRYLSVASCDLTNTRDKL